MNYTGIESTGSVAFNRGEYDPNSPDGQHVIAHELAHVRQRNADISMLPQEGLALEIDPDPKLEQEAEETAQRVVSGRTVGIQSGADVHIQRVTKEETEMLVGILSGKARATDEQFQEDLDEQTEAHEQVHQTLEANEATITDLEDRLHRIHVELSEMTDLASDLWEKIEVAETESYYLNDGTDALQKEYLTRERLYGVLSKASGWIRLFFDVLGETKSLLKAVRSARREAEITVDETDKTRFD